MISHKVLIIRIGIFPPSIKGAVRLRIKDEPSEKRTGSIFVTPSMQKMDVIATPFE